MKRMLLCIAFLTLNVPHTAVWAAGDPGTKGGPNASVATPPPEAVRLLLSRLDLDRPGLERVKAAQNNPTVAARELLAYYRGRTAIKHPVDRSKREESRGQYASERSLEIANDAVKNILFHSAAILPRHDFGAEIDWFTNRDPKRDKEWLAALHRHSWWMHLGRAYWHTGEEKYAEAYVRQLLDWIAKCPVRPVNPREWARRQDWTTINAGIRSFRWTSHFQRFLDSQAFTPAVLVAFLNSCHDHMTYLASRPFTPNNWGLHEAQGMAFIGFAFPEFTKAQGWRARAIRHLNAEISRQVRPDGHHAEQALNYHGAAIRFFLQTAELAAMNGETAAFPDEYSRRIEAMLEVFVKLGLPNGGNTQFGNCSGQTGWRRILARRGAMFDRADFRYIASGGMEGRPPEGTAFALKDSGFYSMRSGWDEDAICLVLKCGPDGGFHCHPDNGTFELYAFGRRLTPDSGSYTYHRDADHRWFRQTRVHQTLTLDGKDSAYAPKLLLWRPGPDLDTLVVENRSYKGLTHRRAVLFVRKSFFVIVDEAMGDAAGNVNVHFQFAPGHAVFDPATLTARTAFERGNLLVQALPQKGLVLEREQGQVSFAYGTKEPRPAFRFRLPKTADRPGLRFVTLLVPYEGADPPPVSIRQVGDQPPGTSQLDLDVRVGSVNERVGYRLE